MEVWLPVDDYEGLYEVSSEGRVRSLCRVVSAYSAKAGKVVPLARKGQILSQNSAGSGYMTACLSKDGISKTVRVAALVCSAFHGKRPSGMFVCHNDGNKTNNRKGNLRWDSPKNNTRDRIAHKTDLRGEQVLTAKFSPIQVAAIKGGMRFCEASSQFGISKSQYYRIVRGEAWAHI